MKRIDPTVDLSVHYTCRFDDPAPVRPVNTDNPGFGVSGTISAVGTFILSGAGWYPRLADARESFNLHVDGPKGTVAVTTGRRLNIDHQGDRTVSHWRIDNPLEGLSLSAGPFVVEQRSGRADRRHLSFATQPTFCRRFTWKHPCAT